MVIRSELLLHYSYICNVIAFVIIYYSLCYADECDFDKK